VEKQVQRPGKPREHVKLNAQDYTALPMDKLLHDFKDNYDHVKSIHLMQNRLVSVAGADLVSMFRNLLELNLSENQLIQFLPPKQCVLELLDLSTNMLERVNPAIAGVQTLTILRLGGNRFKEFPDVVTELSNLRVLDVSHNIISTIPKSLAQLQELELLNVTENMVLRLPDTICTMQALRVLSLDYNKLEELPPLLGNLVNLEHFSVSHNRLRQVPDGIGQCVRLRFLDLSSNCLATVPSRVRELSQLETLLLNGNKLWVRFQSLQAVCHCVALVCACNGQITVRRLVMRKRTYVQILPHDLFTGMKSLRLLHLNHNELRDLPASMVYLQKLHQLLIDYNPLVNLSTEISSLTNLIVLSATHCDLTWPSTVRELVYYFGCCLGWARLHTLFVPCEPTKFLFLCSKPVCLAPKSTSEEG
jgi:Leucine-rich repeat (LRR) protein